MNLLIGVKVGRNDVEISMLQFVEDTLFLCEDSYKSVISLKATLRCFEIAFGLKIKFYKSKLDEINFERNAFDLYAKSLNCSLIRVPFKYLGVIVGGNQRKKQFWEPILSKLCDKLSAWKGRFLSLAGRICLIKSVLTALLLFYFSLFKASTQCIAELLVSKGVFFGRGEEIKNLYPE